MNETNTTIVTVSGKQVTIPTELKVFKLFKPDSSFISYFGTIGAEQGGSLVIQFKDGKCTQFLDIPKEVLDIAEGAGSIGKFYHKFIKGKYEFTELGTHLIQPVPEFEEEEIDEDNLFFDEESY